MNHKVSRFHVNFYGSRKKYTNSVKVDCTEAQFIQLLEDHEPEIDFLEVHYGILDFDGSQFPDATWDFGYESYEISHKEAPIVWDRLCEILKPVIVS